MNFLLLDADVIIDVHRLGFWQQFIEKNRIHISSIILRLEALFYFDTKHRKRPINLRHELSEHELVKLHAIISEIEDLWKRFDLAFAPQLDSGEMECLAILKKREDLKFCTFDGAAITALGLLNLANRGISLERALRECGLQKNLPTKYSDKRFKRYIKQGQKMRITGQGLKGQAK